MLTDEKNDPVHDPKPLRDYMDKWDGQAFIDTGMRKITVFPDTPAEIKSYIANSGLLIIELYETEFVHIFIAEKPDCSQHRLSGNSNYLLIEY